MILLAQSKTPRGSAEHRAIPVALLATFALGVRWWCWSRMPFGLLPSGRLFQLYVEALQSHWGAYLFYDHTQPPGMCLIHGLLLRLVGPSAFSRWLVVPGYLLGSVATVLVYAMLRRLGIPRWVAWTLAAIYSLTLLAVESWVAGGNLDHYTISFTALFAWSLFRRLTGGPRHDWLVAVTGGALLLVQKIGFLAVPAVLVLTSWLLPEGRPSWRRVLVPLLGPLFVTAALILKNWLSVGTYSPSSLAGVNTAQFMWAAEGYDQAALERFAKDSGVPDWYLWCYEHSAHFETMGPFYGMCYLTDGGDHGTYDFAPLQAYLTTRGHTRLARIVEEDRQRFEAKPYLLSYMVPEISPRFAAEYNLISTRLFGVFLRRQPARFARQLIRTQYIYVADGWRFLAILMNNPASHGIQPITWMPLARLILAVTWICGGLLLAGYAATYVVLLVLVGSGLWAVARAWRRRRTVVHSDWPLSESERLTIACMFGVLVPSAAFMLVCCENGRYFLQITPYLLPLLACVVMRLAAWPIRGRAPGPGSRAERPEPALASLGARHE